MKGKRNIALFTLILTVVGTMFPVSHNWNSFRGYAPFIHATQKGLEISSTTDSTECDFYPLKDVTKDLSLKFRAKNNHGALNRKYSYFTADGKEHKISEPIWGFFLTTPTDSIIIRVKGTEIEGMLGSNLGLEISVSIGKETRKIKEDTGFGLRNQENLWKLQIKNNSLFILGGDKRLQEIIREEFDGEITGFGFFVGPGGDVLISDIGLEYSPKVKSVSIPLESLSEYLQGREDPMEGYWTLFDRELEENLVKLGGNYLLACVKEGEEYVMIYLEGAKTNSTNWNNGDIKAILRPSPFEGIFDVEWIDAMKLPLKSDIKAQLGEGNTLLIQLPYQSSKFRLRKISPQ